MITVKLGGLAKWDEKRRRYDIDDSVSTGFHISWTPHQGMDELLSIIEMFKTSDNPVAKDIFQQIRRLYLTPQQLEEDENSKLYVRVD